MATQAQCGACGELNPSDSPFCVECGTYLGWNEPGKAPTAEPTEPMEPTGGAEPPPAGPRTDPKPGRGPATTAPPPTPPPTPAKPAAPTCPSCGHPYEPGRRFCGRCGFALVAAPTSTARPQPVIQPARARWWGGDPQERAARKAYRRSLPLLYRWRRVLVGLLGAALLGALVWFLAGDPVRTLKDKWTELTGHLEPVPEVQAQAQPVGTEAQLYPAADAVDEDPRTAWATAWPSDTPAVDGCGESTAGRLVLTWSPAVRVERIDIRAGLDAQEDASGRQFRPARVDVNIGGECEPVPLKRSSGWQEHTVEFEGEVSSLTVSVADVHRPRSDSIEEMVAISWIRLMTRGE